MSPNDTTRRPGRRRLRSVRRRRARARRADDRAAARDLARRPARPPRPRSPTTSRSRCACAGALDVPALAGGACRQLVDRHEALRATFSADGDDALYRRAASTLHVPLSTTRPAAAPRARGGRCRRAARTSSRRRSTSSTARWCGRELLRLGRSRAPAGLHRAPHRLRRLVVRRDRARSGRALCAAPARGRGARPGRRRSPTIALAEAAPRDTDERQADEALLGSSSSPARSRSSTCRPTARARVAHVRLPARRLHARRRPGRRDQAHGRTARRQSLRHPARAASACCCAADRPGRRRHRHSRRRARRRAATTPWSATASTCCRCAGVDRRRRRLRRDCCASCAATARRLRAPALHASAAC